LLNEFSTVFDEISIKTFFSGFSINCQETMFGWVGQSGFYLRGHQHYRQRFIDLNMRPLALPVGASTKFLDYSQLDDSLINDKPRFYSMTETVIEYAKKDKFKKKKVKELRIKELPNMTFSLERLLYSVGIYDIGTFRKIGYLKAFDLIKKKKNCVSINVLFLLYSGQK